MTWWLWNAWVKETDGTARPFYGFLVETTASEIFSEHQKIPLPSGATLVISQKVLSGNQAAPLLLLLDEHSDTLDLTNYWPESPVILLKAHRTIIAEAFGHSAAKVDCNYGLQPPHVLFPKQQDVQALIEYCTAQLGFSFSDSFATHLGGFDLFHLDTWLDQPALFRSEVVKDTSNHIPNALRIWRYLSKKKQLVIQLCARTDGEIVLDKIVLMAKSIDQLDIALPGQIDAYELRIFDFVDGTLRHKEDTTLVRELNLSMNMPGRTITHSDRLSKKASAYGAKTSQRASSTTTITTTRSLISTGDNSLRAHTHALKSFLDDHLKKPSEDRWFSRSLDSELGVIEHINKMLDASQVLTAILVDPFFGEEALKRLALRLTQRDVGLTVIASWGRTDPDTGVPVGGGAIAAFNLAEIRLTHNLARIAPLVGPKFRFINLVTNSGSQAFHDRYLLLRLHNGSFSVFLLSNSVNNMAANWPFCISKLAGSARLQAKEYIEGLAQGYDITDSTKPQISFQWPTPT